MKDIIDVLSSMEDFDCLNGVSKEEINEAEKDLDLSFAEDYKKYLIKFGLASADGHEFTGIVKSNRLNVVDVTIRLKKIFSGLPKDSYVIEELNIDGIVIFQDSAGHIYEATSEGTKRIAESFSEYLLANK